MCLRIKKGNIMKELTKAEEQVMQLLWKLRKGFVKDVIAEMPEPKPAYNTVSTIIRILETKGFVSHKAYGNTYEYFPTVTKKEYTKNFMKGFVKNYFENSYQQMVSFFAKENELTLTQLDELKEFMEKEIRNRSFDSAQDDNEEKSFDSAQNDTTQKRNKQRKGKKK